MYDKLSNENIVLVKEKLSAIEHERWSHWQKYLHSKCIEQDDGSLVIPSELVARWARLMKLNYSDLSEDEKDSDREQVERYFSNMLEWISAAQS